MNNEQSANNARALPGISCRNLGLIPNNENKALENYNLLLKALKQGTKILVDDIYYIKSPYTSTNPNNEINTEMSIIGKYKQGKFISLGGHLFNAKKDVIIENLSLECISPSNLTYFICLIAPYRLSISIKNNFFTGNVRVVDSSIPFGYDFVNNDCGLTKLDIEGNEFSDIYNSGGSRVIFRLSDTPVTLSNIRNNNVTNFSYVFYSNGITNGNPSSEYIYNNCKKIYIDGNKVVNSDLYDVVVKNGGFKATYFCFCLIETYSCECKNNTFEGIHISDAPDTVVYDNYLSVTELIYENNTWKNNVNFTPDIQYVDIMKSKMGSSTDELTRIYRKNTYIVEPSYADKFGKDRLMLRKNINTYQQWMEKVIIEDNYFDLYTLSFNRVIMAKQYIFNKNTVKAYSVENSFNTQAFIGIYEYKDINGNNLPRQMVFTNNNVIIETPPIGGAVGTKEISLIRNYSGNNDKVTIVFENNYIKMYELKYILSDERSDEITTNNPCLANIKFNGNTVITQRDTNTYLFDKKFKRLFSFKNNEIETLVKNTGNSLSVFYEQSTVAPSTRYSLPLCMDLELDLTYKADQWLRVIPLKGLLDGTYKVSMNVKILSLTTFEEFDINFTLKNDGTNNIIDCIGLDKKSSETQYTQKSYFLDGKAGTYNNFYIQQSNIIGTSTVNVNVSNSATSKEIMLHSFGSRQIFNDDKVKLKLTVTKINPH
ncbi:hypothetical protein P4647_26685 [Peribacillus frigoritolerans]|uniref:hypothetical protein n=1 Tax=Peribacillus frigoritolerans TaxID=450367 RepID=UPI002E24BD54|nr:hypothetical protein [Peribacillus frigoritolerans]